MGLEVKNKYTFNICSFIFKLSSQLVFKVFILGPKVPWRVGVHSMVSESMPGVGLKVKI